MNLPTTSRDSPRSPDMPRRAFMAVFTGGLLAAPLAAEAQSGAGKVPRVGLLGTTSEAGYARQVGALRQGFRDLGYIEGRSIVIEYRWAQGQYDRLPALAAELIRLQPDVIVTSGPGIRVMKEATATIPIVMAVGGDVVASGLVASLAHPGGNLTGSTFFGPELSAKRLELLKEAVPRLARVAVVLNPGGDYHVDLERVKKTAAALNVDLLETPARAPREFREALARARAEGELEVAVLRQNIDSLKAQLKKARQPLDALREIETHAQQIQALNDSVDELKARMGKIANQLDAMQNAQTTLAPGAVPTWARGPCRARWASLPAPCGITRRPCGAA